MNADSIQSRLADYAYSLSYDTLPSNVVHAAKVRIIDTLGALAGGFLGEPCQIARNLAARIRDPRGATIIGTQIKTSPDLAAFVNATTARYAEMNDVHHPGSGGGHPSDVITPVLAAAEHANVNGASFINAIVLAYEVYLAIVEATGTPGFDSGNFVCLGSAAGAGKLFGLRRTQLAHCISMAVVPNNVLRVGRIGHLSMWKTTAAGQAGRAGVFAAMLARAGLEGPTMPFEGKAGWCDHVAQQRFSLDNLGGNGIPFKIQETMIKLRPACAATIPSILAAEKVAPFIVDSTQVRRVVVEVDKKAREGMGSDAHHWDPHSRETADHSIPYVASATLLDGTITPHSFDDSRLCDNELRALMQKVEVVTNEEFTHAHAQRRQMARVTVLTDSRQQFTGVSWGDSDELSAPISDAQITDKFHRLVDDRLGHVRANFILERVWNLELENNLAKVISAFSFA